MVDSAPPLIVSASLSALGVPHGFSTRCGGHSAGPFASMNLGEGLGDVPELVARNLETLASAAGVGTIFRTTQVHGCALLEVSGEADPAQIQRQEADGLFSAASGTCVGVRTADCVPILMAAAGGQVVAAVHAGWRGTLSGIATRAVETLVAAAQCSPRDLVVAIGPCIRACCYEVDAKLAARFEEALGPGLVTAAAATSSGKGGPHLDLQAANLQRLLRAGLALDQVEILAHCTSCDEDRFFSHRRDAGRCGRQLSFIVRPVSFP